MSLVETWQRRSDVEVETAIAELEQYEPSARDVIRTEAFRRGIRVPPHDSMQGEPAVTSGPGVFSLTHLGRVWRGEIGLAETFWLWGFAAVTVIELLAGLPAIGVDHPVAWGFLLLVSFAARVLATVAVYRSARRYQGWKGWKVIAPVVMGLACARTTFILIAMTVL